MIRNAGRFLAATCAVLLGGLACAPAQAADSTSATVAAIRARGQVVCGMQADNPPFSLPDSEGHWRGMDVDSCRSIAAAVLGDPSKVSIQPVTGLTRFPALQGGGLDVLFGSTTWTTTRETQQGLIYAGSNYYSGQGFLVKKSLGVGHVKELDGATICVPPGSTTEVILQDYFRKIGASFRPVIIDDPNQIQSAFLSGRCDAYTRDVTGLAGFRSRQPNPDDLVVLPEVITMEPLGAFIRKGDDAWLDIVRWSLFVPLVAEELGVTQANLAESAKSTSPDVRRLLGLEGAVGASMGLDKEWAAHIIKAVGNYAEMWDRNVKPLGIQRGLNRQWNEGGLQFAPPMR